MMKRMPWYARWSMHVVLVVDGIAAWVRRARLTCFAPPVPHPTLCAADDAPTDARAMAEWRWSGLTRAFRMRAQAGLGSATLIAWARTLGGTYRLWGTPFTVSWSLQIARHSSEFVVRESDDGDDVQKTCRYEDNVIVYEHGGIHAGGSACHTITRCHVPPASCRLSVRQGSDRQCFAQGEYLIGAYLCVRRHPQAAAAEVADKSDVETLMTTTLVDLTDRVNERRCIEDDVYALRDLMVVLVGQCPQCRAALLHHESRRQSAELLLVHGDLSETRFSL